MVLFLYNPGLTIHRAWNVPLRRARSSRRLLLLRTVRGPLLKREVPVTPIVAVSLELRRSRISLEALSITTHEFLRDVGTFSPCGMWDPRIQSI